MSPEELEAYLLTADHAKKVIPEKKLLRQLQAFFSKPHPKSWWILYILASTDVYNFHLLKKLFEKGVQFNVEDWFREPHCYHPRCDVTWEKISREEGVLYCSSSGHFGYLKNLATLEGLRPKNICPVSKQEIIWALNLYSLSEEAFNFLRIENNRLRDLNADKASEEQQEWISHLKSQSHLRPSNFYYDAPAIFHIGMCSEDLDLFIRILDRNFYELIKMPAKKWVEILFTPVSVRRWGELSLILFFELNPEAEKLLMKLFSEKPEILKVILQQEWPCLIHRNSPIQVPAAVFLLAYARNNPSIAKWFKETPGIFARMYSYPQGEAFFHELFGGESWLYSRVQSSPTARAFSRINFAAIRSFFKKHPEFIRLRNRFWVENPKTAFDRFVFKGTTSMVSAMARTFFFYMEVLMVNEPTLFLAYHRDPITFHLEHPWRLRWVNFGMFSIFGPVLGLFASELMLLASPQSKELANFTFQFSLDLSYFIVALYSLGDRWLDEKCTYPALIFTLMLWIPLILKLCQSTNLETEPSRVEVLEEESGDNSLKVSL